tara:strand:- start:640 stop:1131 length:492 start_codon:yes stop_codon:yes gene_type:complete
MRINFNRMSQLAGLPADSNGKSLYEGKDHKTDAEEGMEMHEEEETATYEGTALDGLDEMDAEDDLPEMDHMDEMIEIDEVMLVQELRRAKGIMQESKRRRLSESRRRQIFDKQLKQVIDEEVSNVMDEMNLTAGWVYGDNRPQNSRKGYTNQGSFLPGFGFKR